MNRKIILLVMVTAVTFFSTAALSQEGRLEAVLERNRVFPGNPVYLNVTFYGSQDIARPDMPVIEGLKIKYVGPATEISIVNGKVSRSITHSYLVIPVEKGDFKIGPFFVEYHGEMYSAAPVMLSVNGRPSAVSGGVSQAQASSGQAPSPDFTPARKPYTGDRVFLVMEVPEKKVFINEVVPLTIKLYVTNMGLKEIEYPVFDHEGFSAAQWEEPEKRQEAYKGELYHVLIFRRNLFGIKEGSYALGPASVGCKVMVRKQTRRRSSFSRRSVFDDDFFSDVFARYQTYPLELESNPVEMAILPFPEKNKPADFEGAVGGFDMEVHAEPRKVKVGDPITVRMIVTGSGNMDTVTAPEIKVGEAFKIYEPQVTKKGNRKIYEQILIPKTMEIKEIPAISFSYFNPRKSQYKTITKEPVAVEVLEQPESERAVKMVSIGGVERMIYPPEKLGEDILHIKENIGALRQKGGFLYKNVYFWGGQLVPVGLFLAFALAHRKKEKIRTDRRYARFLRAPRSAREGVKRSKAYLHKNDTGRFYDTVFRTLQEYLGNKFDLPGGGVTAQIMEDTLKPAGCDEDILKMIREVFTACDMARYASQAAGGEEAGKILEKARRIIDYLEKTKL